MQSFISETLEDILKTTKSFENAVFILPSQRAGVFVKKQLKELISAGFLPEIITIEEFITRVSEIKKADTIPLLFHFYSLYKQEETAPDSFDTFSSWAFTVLQDFNEIDQHLIPAKDLFIYVRDIERLRKWSVKGTFKETELIKNHTAFLERLDVYYHIFYTFLVENSMGYQGLMYREATKKIEGFIEKNTDKKFFFIGFNALNKAEEFLFEKMLSAKNTEVYWDIDQTFFESNHQAGKFIRKYTSEWKYYHKNTVKTIANNFSSAKNIELIGISKNVTQMKKAGEILGKLPNHNNTALVLADESLLPVTLNSLPQNVPAVNITMGYPLKDIPTTQLFFSIFKLFLTQEKLQQKTKHLFYHKDVVRFFKDAAIVGFLSEKNSAIATEITQNIVDENLLFLSEETIIQFFKNTETQIATVLGNLFKPYDTVSHFLDRILNLIQLLKETANPLEKEYLFRFFTLFTQLQSYQNEFSYFQDLKTVQQFLQQLMGAESLSFQGEPLQGLQLMGMLETRVLDFENVIITSVNEGVLPNKNLQNSFIPFDVKVAFGLPTYREKDAIFSYHFFRLLQRAKNVYLLYNTAHDVFGNGEKSRFLLQLEQLKKDISEKIVIPKLITEQPQEKEIPKNEAVLESLKTLAQKGFSPSAITNYLYNPIRFYKQKILKINEFEEVKETIAANTLGTVIHDTLDALYTPFKGVFLTAKDVKDMQEKAKDLVTFYFAKHFKNGNVTTGKNRLIFEVANRFVANFLRQEENLVKDPNNQLKIIATEQQLSTEIAVEGIPFPIKIGGIVDRVDELNGVLRIIDYKTGMVSNSQLKLPDFLTIREEKYHKAIQVLLYAFLYTQNHTLTQALETGIYSFKNLQSGFLKVNFSAKRNVEDTLITQARLSDFMAELKKVFLEIYDLEVPFIEPLGLGY